MNVSAGAGLGQLGHKPSAEPSTPACLAILGPGLIGGSLIRALKAWPGPPTLRVWGRSERSLTPAREFLGTEAFFTTSAREAVAGADGVILCTPVEAMPALAAEIAGALSPTTWVTDAGSVKGTVVKALEPLLGPCFLGAHPMAGSEKTGFRHSSADLFQDAVCILTPTNATTSETRQAVAAFWQNVGCRLLESTPEAHDRAIAAISHVPHVVAAALVLSANEEAQSMTGPGFRDCTRIAMGDAGLWTGILRENRPALLDALGAFRHQLDSFMQAIAASDAAPASAAPASAESTVVLHTLLHEAAQRREKLRAQSAIHPSAPATESL